MAEVTVGHIDSTITMSIGDYRIAAMSNREATELFYALGSELGIATFRDAFGVDARLAVLEEQVRKVDQFNERLSAVETLHRDYAEIREKMQVFGTFEN